MRDGLKRARSQELARAMDESSDDEAPLIQVNALGGKRVSVQVGAQIAPDETEANERKPALKRKKAGLPAGARPAKKQGVKVQTAARAFDDEQEWSELGSEPEDFPNNKNASKNESKLKGAAEEEGEQNRAPRRSQIFVRELKCTNNVGMDTVNVTAGSVPLLCSGPSHPRFRKHAISQVSADGTSNVSGTFFHTQRAVDAANNMDNFRHHQTWGARFGRENSVTDDIGDVLRAIQASSPPLVCSRFWSDVCMPTGNNDPLYWNLMCNGPEFGQEGRVSSLLWRISDMQDVNPGRLHPDFLNFLRRFSLILNNDKSPNLYYGKQTERTDILIASNPQCKKINGLRYRTPEKQRALQARSMIGTEASLHPSLVRKLLAMKRMGGRDQKEDRIDVEEYSLHGICGVEEGLPYYEFNVRDPLSHLEPFTVVHKTQEINDPEECGQPLKYQDSLEDACMSASPPIDFIYFWQIVSGVDENGVSKHLCVEGVKMQSPNAIEPLEALRQACQKDAELSNSVLSIAKHMCTVMNWQLIDNMQSLFSLSSMLGAYDLMNEGNILMAVMLEMKRLGIRGEGDTVATFNGMYLDVDNTTQMRAWNREQQVIIDERKAYAAKIKEHVVVALNSGAKGIETAQRDVRDEIINFPESVYTGMHMRILNTKQMRCLQKAKIEEIKRKEWANIIEENEAELRDEFGNANFEKFVELQEEFVEITAEGGQFYSELECVYSIESMAKGALKFFETEEDKEMLNAQYAFPFNGSVILNGNTSFFWRFHAANVKEDRMDKQIEIPIESPWTATPLAMAKFIAISTNDESYKEFFEVHKTKQLIPSCDFIMNTDRCSGSQSILTLRMLIADLRQREREDKCKDTTLQVLLGFSQSNNIQTMVKNIEKSASLGSLVQQRMWLINAMLQKQTSLLFSTKALEYQSNQMKVIQNLDVQSKKNSKIWSEHAKRVIHIAQNQGRVDLEGNGAMLTFVNDENVLNELWRQSMNKIEHGLCSCNINLLQMLFNNMTIFCFNDIAAAGYCILISDGGCQYLVRFKNKFGIKDEVLQRKSPGAGADMLCDYFGKLQLIYNQNINTCEASLAYFTDPARYPEKLNAPSRMSLQSIGSSAVFPTDENEFGNDLLDKFGIPSFMTDMFKTRGKVGSQGTMNLIEQAVDTLMKHRLGVQTQAWTTSEGMKRKEMRRIIAGIPLFLVCSNSGDPELCDSTLYRITQIHSATQDGERGLLKIDDDFKKKGNSEIEFELNSSSVDSRDFIEFGKHDVVLRNLNAELARQYPIFFIGNSGLHCVVKQLMTGLDFYSHCPFTLREDPVSIVQNIATMCSGLMRGVVGGELNIHRDKILRLLLHGRLMTTDVPGEHMWQNWTRCFFQRAQIFYENNYGTELKLSSAVNDFIYSMLYVPVSLQTMLSSLYLNMTTNVLNVNMMIASTFLLYVARCPCFCPIEVMALSACDFELSKQQDEALLNMFKYFDLICDTPSEKKKRCGLKQDADEVRFVKNCPSLLTTQELHVKLNPEIIFDIFFKFEDREVHSEILTWAKDNIVSSSAKKSKSYYVKTCFMYDFTTVPASLQPKDPRAVFKASTQFEGSVEKARFFLLAEMLKEDYIKDVRKDVNNQIEAGTYEGLSFIDPAVFFQAAFQGARFPQNKKFGTDASFRDHCPTQEIPEWWINFNTDMRFIGLFVDHILQFFRLPPNATRKELFDAVFRRCSSTSLLKNKLNHLFPDNPQSWSQSIRKTIDENYSCIFVQVEPCISKKRQVGNMVVETPTGVRVVLCVDILWLLLSQALFSAEWLYEVENHRQISVHLRNMGHCARALLTIFLHTQVSLSGIPAHAHNRLTIRNMNCNQEVMDRLMDIPFYLTLHKDFILHKTQVVVERNGQRMSVDTEVFINITPSSRRNSKGFFELVTCKDSTVVLAYRKDVYDNNAVMVPENKFDSLSPFVPESIAHMLTWFKHIMSFSNRFYTEYQETVSKLGFVQNFVGLAIHIAAGSWTSDLTNHVPLTLTATIFADTDGKLEIPIVTLGRVNGMRMGFLGILRRKGNLFTVHGIEPTSQFCTEEIQEILKDNDLQPWKALPLDIDAKVMWKASDLSLAQSYGLCWDNDRILMRHPRDIIKKEMHTVPFMLMPIFRYQSLVLIHARNEAKTPEEPERWHLKCPEHGKLQFDEDMRLAVIVHHPHTPHFLKNGCYALSFYHEDKVCCNVMDFMSCSHCILREGQELFLLLSPSICQSLESMTGGGSVGQSAWDDVHGELQVQLKCYYVLADSSYHYYESMESLKIDVMILVSHSDLNTGKITTKKLFYQSKLYDQRKRPLFSCVQECDTLVCDLISGFRVK